MAAKGGLGSWALPAALLLAAAGCSGTPPAAPVAVEIHLAGQGASLEGSPIAIGRLYHSPHQTVNLVRLEAPMGLHRHLHSEETVYVVSGQGTLHLGTSDRELKAGDLVVVPRNTPHGYTPGGEEPSVVLSIFAPAFREGDRHFEEPVPPEEQRP